MAVANRLQGQAAQKKENQIMEYDVAGMKITLTPATVKNYLVSGDKDRVTLEEIATFMNLCKYSKLNPWVKEAYCIKYGSEPATMVVSKEAFQKRADSNPNFDGSEAGIVVMDSNGEIVYRSGTMKLPEEKIIGGWAEVWRNDRAHSTRIEVSYDEYVGLKKDGTPNRQWAAKPATMIRKVALAQALREAFPSALGGMFTAEEQGQVEELPMVDFTDQAPDQTALPEPEPAETALAQSPEAALFAGKQ